MRRFGRDARILLVDDCANDVEIALLAFAERRFDGIIDVARSGAEALARLVGPPPGVDGEPSPQPDLILLDLKMPGIDGFDILSAVKAAPLLRRIPVIILTSSREEEDRAMAYDAGANSYLVKPVSFEGMLQIVDAIAAYWLALNVRPPLPGRSDPLSERDA